jgi:hypothetical protein
MARNFTKEKEMIQRLSIVITLLFGLCFLAGAFPAEANEGVTFTLAFSANVNGELAPCG